MNDAYTKAYLEIITEWKQYDNNREIKQYSVSDIALATAQATNDFASDWVKGRTGKDVVAKLNEIIENGNSEQEKSNQLVMDAFEYWQNKDDDFGIKCQNIFQDMICPSDKLGLFAFAIWQGVKSTRFAKSADGKFKIGEKINLTLTCIDEYTSSFNFGDMMGYHRHYYNTSYTNHYVFSCNEYPHIKFDIVFGRNGMNFPQAPEDANRKREYKIIKGDVFEIEAKIKKVDSRNAIVYLNYAKIVSVKSFAEDPETVKIRKKSELLNEINKLAQPIYEKISNELNVEASSDNDVILRTLLFLDIENGELLEPLKPETKSIFLNLVKGEINNKLPGLSKYVNDFEEFFEKYDELVKNSGI